MRALLAETLGTFILVLFGTGAVVIDQEIPGSISHVGIAMTFGFVVLALIYALGPISGAHFNPAVSLAFYFSGKFEGRLVLPYVLCQLAGALLASAVMCFLFPGNATLGATLPAGSSMQSFVLEVILAFFLMLVILQVAQGSREQGMFAGLAIGAVILVEAMFAGPVSGASMNPARSIGPALVSGHLEALWIYILAPLIGASAAVPVGLWFSRQSG